MVPFSSSQEKSLKKCPLVTGLLGARRRGQFGILCTVEALAMSISIKSLVPNADDLLALEVEEVAAVLLVHLASFGVGSNTGIVSQGRFSPYNFFLTLSQHPEYPRRQDEVNNALMEGWSWLEREGLLVRDANQSSSPWFFLSRRAQLLKSREEVTAYRHSNLLPKAQLHPLVANRANAAFLRGEYDTAIFQAFREVEVAVREAGGFPAESVGTKLMRDAFRPLDPEKPTAAAGPLTDKTLPLAEQKGMADLFAGSIAMFKNPTSHRIVKPEPAEAAEVIALASHLLRMVDRLKSLS
jgi:uncharacterized protein (TIGR02391 family)